MNDSYLVIQTGGTTFPLFNPVKAGRGLMPITSLTLFIIVQELEP